MERCILLLVEGEKTEVTLFKKILELFPEIKIEPGNIISYNTNIWALNTDLKRHFGVDWCEMSEIIDFREFMQSRYPVLKNKKITDIFLIFDYERQDPLFDPDILEKMSLFFNNSIENGQLYINFPMIEAFKHLTEYPLPDEKYKDRKCFVENLKDYKQTVGLESKYSDIRKYNRELLKNIAIHNLKKYSYLINNNYDLTKCELINICNNISSTQSIKKQNTYSMTDEGFVYVLCSSIFFICEYNKKLILD